MATRRRIPVAILGVAMALIAAVIAVVVLLGGHDERRAGPAPTTAPGEPTGDPHRRPPGTALGHGLVVPDGAWLAGAVFEVPGDPRGAGPPLDGWTAVLGIDGDPLAVWDALARQVEALDALPTVGGSADRCYWDALDRTRFSQDMDGARGQEIGGIECGATARLDVGRQGDFVVRTLHVGLEDVTGIHPHLDVTLTDEHPTPGRAMRPAEEVDVRRAQLSGAELAIERREDEVIPVGRPFRGGANCFAAPGPGDFSLPPGSEVVLVGGHEGFATSVLAVEDGPAAMEALAAQLRGDGTDADHSGDLEEVPLADGDSVLEIHASVAAGGGACSLRTTADRRYVLIEAASD